MEPDRTFDVSPTAFSAPEAASTPPQPHLTPETSPTQWSSADVEPDYNDWETPQVRESVVWGFRAFVAFAGLVFLMFLGQLLSGDDDGGSSRTPSGPEITTSVPADGSPAPAPALSDDLSGDGF